MRKLETLKRLLLKAKVDSHYLAEYDVWAEAVFTNNIYAPRTILTSSWTPGTEWYNIAAQGLMDAEFAYAKHLISTLGASGSIIEFGVFEGMWLSIIADHCEKAAIRRNIIGLDSFQGLPKTTKNDLDCWSEGQYAADYELVANRLRIKERPHINLVKGWFSDTLPSPQMQSIKEIAFARIDCDLYGPTVECLEYLEPRLSNGAILVFDDWTWNLEKGETKAFKEWACSTSIKFTLLSYGLNGHLYLQAIHS